MTSPIRELRTTVAEALAPLGVNTYDVLPDHANPPLATVGLPSIAPSAVTAGLLVLGLDVTVVGERADFASAQVRLDDLAYQAWSLLRSANGGTWVLEGRPQSIEAGGQSYPGFVITVESVIPCPS